MTAKPWTPGVALRHLLKTGVLPPDSAVDARRGVGDWTEHDMRFRLRLWRNSSCGLDSGLDRSVFVSPSGILGRPQEEGGMDATIAIGQASPLESDLAGDVDGLSTFVELARIFVADRADLTWLLMQEHDVWRGPLHTRLYQGYPARLVKALALAGELGDIGRAQEVLNVLHSGRQVLVAPFEQEDILHVARRRARELEQVTGIAISLVGH